MSAVERLNDTTSFDSDRTAAMSRASSNSSNAPTLVYPAWVPQKAPLQDRERMRRRSSVDLRSAKRAQEEQTERSSKKEKKAQGEKEKGGRGKEEEDKNVVNWREKDEENPRNWPEWKKWMVVLSILPADIAVSFGSTGYSPAQDKFAEDMGVSSVVAVLPLSLFVLGFALGPLILAWGGRWGVYVYGHALMTIWIIASAVAPNLGSFLVLRLIGACCGAMSISNIGGTIADLWPPNETAPATSLYVASAVAGPGLGYACMSIVAQFRPWRDVIWGIAGVAGGTLIILLLGQRETRHSILLEKRLKKLKKETGNEKLHLPKGMQRTGWADLMKNHLVRPIKFQFTEGIVIAAALINVQLFGVNYLFTGAYPLVFGENGSRVWNTLQVGMTWFGLVIGGAIGPLTHIPQERKFRRETKENGDILVPERRLDMACVAGVVYPASLFWFAWTTYPSVHWIVPVIASFFFGWSFFSLILMVNQYLTDSYGEFAASALAAASLARNLAGAGFPLFGTQMYERLGNQWATSLIAFLALLVTPIPFVWRRYGKKLRLKSPHARKHMEEIGEDTGEGGGNGEA
ncbi:hypothetical protein JCM8547_003488 [Rhodosporidiobolus lusitaniae]